MAKFAGVFLGLSMLAFVGVSGCGGDDDSSNVPKTTDVNTCFFKCGSITACKGSTKQTDTACRAKAETDCGATSIEEYVFMEGCECSNNEGMGCAEPSWY